MRKSIKATLAGAATVAAMATAFIGINATSASAMDTVPCPAGGPGEFTQVTVHYQNATGAGSGDGYPCFANGGEYDVTDSHHFGSDPLVLTHIHTGNNRVQYFADGRWQPDQPYPKNGDFDVPNAVIQKLRIV